MAQKEVTIMLKIRVRDFSVAESAVEGLEKEDRVGAAEAFDWQDLAESIAAYVEAEQDELLAGLNQFVKVVTCEGHVE